MTRGADRLDAAGRTAEEAPATWNWSAAWPIWPKSCNRVPTAAHAVYYAEIVRDKATLRSLIHSSTESSATPTTRSLEPREMLARAEQKIFSILDARGRRQAWTIIGNILQDAMARIDARMKKEHAIGGIETGFTDLDALTGGLHDSELIILAGPARAWAKRLWR